MQKRRLNKRRLNDKMMFKARMNVELLIECAEAIVGVVDEAVLSITRDGLEVNAVDPANVAMVGLKLSRSSFDNFEFESPEDPLKIGIDFANLLRVLKSWKRKPVELELREKTLFVRSGIFDYSISRIDPSSVRREPRDPELTFTVNPVDIKAELFTEAIRALKLVCEDFVSIGVKDEELYMLAEGERDTLKAVLGQLSHIGDVCSSHSIEYLSAMCEGMNTETINLSLRSDYPIRFDFDIAYGKGKVSYLLAPRILPHDD